MALVNRDSIGNDSIGSSLPVRLAFVPWRQRRLPAFPGRLRVLVRLSKGQVIFWTTPSLPEILSSNIQTNQTDASVVHVSLTGVNSIYSNSPFID